MNKMIMALVLSCLPLTAFAQQELSMLTEQGKGIIKVFSGYLKTELVESMDAGGPLYAIGVCNEAAPRMSDAHSEMSGWEFNRTSLKPRNADNAPDDWEFAVLKDFEEQKASGTDPVELVHSEILEENGRRVFRIMQAIPTVELCTKCHGESISPLVEDKLNLLYPEDKARGFRVGDIRGAFTLEKAL
jgi:hypothetical protein